MKNNWRNDRHDLDQHGFFRDRRGLHANGWRSPQRDQILRPEQRPAEFSRAGYEDRYGEFGAEGREGARERGDLPSYVGRGPKGYTRSDERIREDICEVLLLHPDIDASDIEVEVHQGEITLSGTVETRRMKRLAEDLCEFVTGVADVHNRLRLSSSSVSLPESESHPQ